jgi:pre-mRNA-processing factor 39
VKPLERSQLKNWRAYLDFEVKESDHERVIVLYERCLIACALYEDMWIRVG